MGDLLGEPLGEPLGERKEGRLIWLRMERMTDSGEMPLNRGPKVGRHAPITPRLGSKEVQSTIQ